MKYAHTPGPWTVDSYHDRTFRISGPEFKIGDEICHRLESDKRLIAAAPDLLAALEFIRADINDPLMSFDQDTIVKRYSDFINRVLTKAKGV